MPVWFSHGACHLSGLVLWRCGLSSASLVSLIKGTLINTRLRSLLLVDLTGTDNTPVMSLWLVDLGLELMMQL